jgi:hypothetical protein
MPGNWEPNDRFKCLNEIPDRIRKTGAIPGIWLAPTAIYETHPYVTERRDCVQRLPDGRTAVVFSNWEWSKDNVPPYEGYKGLTWFLDPDHPESKAYIYDLIHSFSKRGWKYFKFDFTHALSTMRVKYDRKKTRFETQRDLYKLIREAAGEDAIICACIGGNFRYPVGIADTVRSGGDTGWDYDCVKSAISDIAIRVFTHGVWWLTDPDVYYMRNVKSELNLEESWMIKAL